MPAAADRAFMLAALALAARGIGDTWPNPSVGCVIVKNGIVVGRGWTQSGWRPHAETEALARAGAAAEGSTVYATLEPCSHVGRTQPCADALIAAKVARVVVAIGDTDPRVSGNGYAKLRAAGIEMVEGVCKAEAHRLNAGFFRRVSHNRPLFAVKTAASFDGRIALASGESRWITGLAARHAAHAVRARFDAMLVGSGTVLADDPELTCRLDGYAGRQKVRIVLDRRLRISPKAKLITTAKTVPTWIMTAEGAVGGPLIAAGADVIGLPAKTEATFMAAVAQTLASRGLTRVLVEGGGQVAASFLRAGMADEAYWFSAPKVLGGDGRAGIGALGLSRLADAPGFRPRASLELGEDKLDIMERA